MIKINKINNSLPFIKFKTLYQKAKKNNQRNIEAAVVASYCQKTNSPDARYVNIKYINDKDFVFFSNYESNKAHQFISNDNVSIVFFWNTINTQIRMKAKIKKIDSGESDDYFINRSKEKNALAISSYQSKTIDTYDDVVNNYDQVLKNCDLNKRPSYWGGYKFQPFIFEFWKGNEYRLNKRELFKLEDGIWSNEVIQP